MNKIEQIFLQESPQFYNTLILISQVIVATGFFTEVLSFGNNMRKEHQLSPVRLWLDLGMKYGIFSLLILGSHQLFQALQFFYTKLIPDLAQPTTKLYAFTPPTEGHYIYQQFLLLFGDSLEFMVHFFIEGVELVRLVQFYLLKSLLPLFIALAILPSFQHLLKRFFKLYFLFVLQGIVLRGLNEGIAYIVKNDLWQLKLSERMTPYLTSYISIGKGLLILFLVFYSLKLFRKVVLS